MLATVTLLMLLSTEVSLRYFIQYIKNQLFKEMFFALKNLIVLSTVRYKTFLAKNDAHKCFNM